MIQKVWRESNGRNFENNHNEREHMENISLYIKEEQYRRSVQELLKDQTITVVGEPNDHSYTLELVQGMENKISVQKQNYEIKIYFREPIQMYRGISLFLAKVQEEEFCVEENVNFETNGIMIDCARNAVPKIETLKQYVRYLAQFGMNRLYLYLEDVIELEEYPYWG